MSYLCTQLFCLLVLCASQCEVQSNAEAPDYQYKLLRNLKRRGRAKSDNLIISILSITCAYHNVILCLLTLVISHFQHDQHDCWFWHVLFWPTKWFGQWYTHNCPIFWLYLSRIGYGSRSSWSLLLHVPPTHNWPVCVVG